MDHTHATNLESMLRDAIELVRATAVRADGDIHQVMRGLSSRSDAHGRLAAARRDLEVLRRTAVDMLDACAAAAAASELRGGDWP